MPDLIEPPASTPLDGHEPLIGLQATVSDFWRFALPDLRMNNVRGWFAEYLIWRALGVDSPRRIEWDALANARSPSSSSVAWPHDTGELASWE